MLSSKFDRNMFSTFFAIKLIISSYVRLIFGIALQISGSPTHLLHWGEPQKVMDRWCCRHSFWHSWRANFDQIQSGSDDISDSSVKILVLALQFERWLWFVLNQSGEARSCCFDPTSHYFSTTLRVCSVSEFVWRKYERQFWILSLISQAKYIK